MKKVIDDNDAKILIKYGALIEIKKPQHISPSTDWWYKNKRGLHFIDGKIYQERSYYDYDNSFLGKIFG